MPPPSFWVLAPSLLFAVVGMTFLLPIMVTVKAQWYTDCDIEGSDRSNNGDNNDSDCKANYVTAQKYSGLFDSMRSFIAFLVSSIMGRASDSVGRKPVILFSAVISTLPVAGLVLTNGKSAAVYFTMIVISGLNGIVAGVGFPGSLAYIADVYEKEQRLKYYGYVGGVTGFSLCLSPFLTYLSSSLSDQTLFLLSFILSCVNCAYIALVLPESLPKEKRNPFVFSRTLNPFSSLKLMKRSAFVLWLSVLIFFVSLPESGIVEIALFYSNDMLGLERDEARRFNSLYLGLTGIFGVFSLVFLLRFLKHYLGVREFILVLFGIILNALHMLLYVVLFFYPHRNILYLNSLVTGLYLLLNPSINALLSNTMGPLEQGFAQGTAASARSLTGSFGPLVFSQLYSQFDHEKYIPFVVGTFMAVVSFFIALFPLRWAMEAKPTRELLYSHSLTYGRRGIGANGSALSGLIGGEGEDDSLRDDDEEGTNPYFAVNPQNNQNGREESNYEGDTMERAFSVHSYEGGNEEEDDLHFLSYSPPKTVAR